MTRQSNRGVSATISDWERQDSARDEARVVPAIRSRELALEQRVRDPILLAQAQAEDDPLDVAAEAEEPDAVALAEIGLGQRCGRAAWSSVLAALVAAAPSASRKTTTSDFARGSRSLTSSRPRGGRTS